MFFTQHQITNNARVARHWDDLWMNRDIWATTQDQMVELHRNSLSPEILALNAVGGAARDFWADIDAQIIQLRTEVIGMEILDDLLPVQTTLPVGKTAKLYNVVGDIADDVAISMDGQAPFSFDHTEYDSDGDPVPMFTAGYGVNWRHAEGLRTVGIDLVLDSQSAKLRKYNQKLVAYLLDGSSRISVDGKPGQGLRNHRNTVKLDLGAGGANIDLTTATAAQYLAFFGTGAFGQMTRNNRVTQYDTVWVSPEIWANLSQPYLIDVNGGTNGLIGGSVMNAILPFAPVRQFRMTYALKGNEMLGYERRRDVVSPLVGMTTGVVPLPRPLPNVNYNFQIMGAMGVQVKKDGDGHAGVFYAADLG